MSNPDSTRDARAGKSCAWVEERLAALLHGGLSAADAQAVEQHLQACPACTQKLQAFQKLQTHLSAQAALSAPVLSARSRQRILEQVQPKLRTGTMMNGTLNFARTSFRLLSLAALLALIVVFTGWIMRLRAQPAAQPTLTPTPSATPSALPAALPTSTLVTGQAALTFAAPDSQVAEFRRLADEFQSQHPEISIQVVPIEKLIANDYQNAVQRLVGGADAALYTVDPGALSQGLLYDLAPFIDAAPGFEKEDFYPGVLEAFAWNGGTWGLAQQIDLNLVLYDRKAFEQAGLAPPDLAGGWTPESFLETAKSLTRSQDGAPIYGFVDANRQFLYSVMNASLRQALSQGRLDTPEMLSALQGYSDLAMVHQVSPELSADQGWEQASALVQDSQAAMWSDGLYNYQYYTQQEGRELGLAPFPTPDGLLALATSNAYFISAGTQYPQEAWLWLDFLSRQRLESGLPNAPVGLPPRRSLAQGDYWEQFDAQALPGLQYAAEHLAFTPLDPSGAAGYLWAALENVRTGMSVQDALNIAQQAYAQSLAQAAQSSATPAQPLAPQTPLPGAVRIKFFNSGLPDDQLYQLVEQFQAENPGIQIDVLDYHQYGPKDADCFGSAASIQGVTNLQPFLDSDPALKAQFNPAVLQAFQQGNPPGTLYSLPWQVTPLMIRYNKALFDAAGLAYPSPDWTLEDFLATARALTRQTENGMQYGYVSQQGESEDLAIFAAAQGVSFWDENGQPRFDTPEALAAVQWTTGLALKHAVTPVFKPLEPGDPGPGDFEYRLELIRSGRAAMWSEFYPYNAMLGIEPAAALGWAPWPGGARRATDTFFDGFSISAGAEQAQALACWDWMRFLSGSAGAVQSIPARLDVQSSPVYLENAYGYPHAVEDLPLLEYVLQNYANAYELHNVDMSVRSLLDALLEDIFSGTPVDEALGKIQQHALQGTPTPYPVAAP